MLRNLINKHGKTLIVSQSYDINRQWNRYPDLMEKSPPYTEFRNIVTETNRNNLKETCLSSHHIECNRFPERSFMTMPTEETVEIIDISLLSASEYRKLKNRIEPLKTDCTKRSISDYSWWLRTKTSYKECYSTVLKDGSIYDKNPEWCKRAVRPVLRIVTPLNIGEKFEWNNFVWTVISDKYALCDDIISSKPINSETNRNHEFTISDLKRFLNSHDFINHEKGTLLC